MPKRRIDPLTGEPELTYREQMLVDQFISNGGNGSRAAASAGYGSARPDQSAYQVLRRPEVQRRIQARIAESRVCADEIIGTLASFMRGTLADFFDESGEFSIEVAKQRGVDHLLKNITATTREIEATVDKPAQVVRTYRGQLHSQVQAATVLARILGIDRNHNLRPLTTAHRPVTTDIQHDFDPLVWLDDLIGDQMRQTGQSRSAVIDSLVQIRPEMAKYVRDLDGSRAPRPFDDLSLRDTARDLSKTLDLLVSLANCGSAEPQHAASDNAGSDAQGSDLQGTTVPSANLQLATSNLQPDTQESQPLPMFSPAPGLQQEIASQTPPAPKQGAPLPTQDSRLKTRDSILPMFSPAPAPQQEGASQTPLRSKQGDPHPTPSVTPNLQPATCSLQPVPTQDPRLTTPDSPFFSSQNFQLIYRSLSEATGKALDRLRFSDLVQEWMDRFDLTEPAAIDAIRERAGLEPSLFGFIVGMCIKEYQRMRSTGLIREPVAPFQAQSLPPTAAPPIQESRLTTPDYENSHPLPMFCSAPLTTEPPQDLSRHFP